MDDIFRHLHAEPAQVCRFLAIFSRLEYALKSTRFAAGNQNNVQAAWDIFANEIDARFLQLQNQDLSVATKYLLENPPRKQVLDNGKLAFVARALDQNQKTTQQLLLMTRTVRNNLFHGGKYALGEETEPGRNQCLIQYSMTVLEACSQLDTDVRNSFDR